MSKSPGFLCRLFAGLALPLELAAFAVGVEEVERVMHDARIARLHFVGDDELVLGQIGRQHEAAEDVVPAGTDDEIFLGRQDQVGLSPAASR